MQPELLRRLPKTDLHLHLDGSLRLPTLIDLARQRKIALPSETEEGMREKVFRPHYTNLAEYLEGFTYTVAALQTPEALERAAFELAEDCQAEGVRYMEVRFAPQLHVQPGFEVSEVVRAVDKGLRRAAEAYAIPVLGGHTQLGVPAALSATALGRTDRPVPGGGGRPGMRVRLTADLGGRWRPGYHGRQWDSTSHRTSAELRAMFV